MQLLIFLFVIVQTNELETQRQLRKQLLEMDDKNSQLRQEYEMLKIEFEQNLVANEQTGPINREMRHLITSLKDHNIQLKSDLHRYKRKYKELSAELGRVSGPFLRQLLFKIIDRLYSRVLPKL